MKTKYIEVIDKFENFEQFQRIFKRALDVWSEFAKFKCIELLKTADGFKFMLHLSAEAKLFMSNNALMSLTQLGRGDNTANYTECYLYTKIAEEGVSVFKPTTYQLTMMEEMILNMPIEDYHQPFPTMIIDLPKDFYQQRKAMIPQVGEDSFGEILPETHDPRFCIIHFDEKQKCMLFCACFSSGQSIKYSLTFKDGEEIEAELQKTEIRFNGAMETSEEEEKISGGLLRACINYCLLVEELGLKKLGPKNPKHYEKLDRKRRERRITPPERAILDRLPIYYTIIDQNVVLHRTVENESDLPAEPTGRTKKPHKRRGHRHAYWTGPGRTIKIYRRIPPVFVNKHLFVGNMNDVKTTYKTKE